MTNKLICFERTFFDLKINFFHFTQKSLINMPPLKSSKQYSETLLKSFFRIYVNNIIKMIKNMLIRLNWWLVVSKRVATFFWTCIFFVNFNVLGDRSDLFVSSFMYNKCFVLHPYQEIIVNGQQNQCLNNLQGQSWHCFGTTGYWLCRILLATNLTISKQRFADRSWIENRFNNVDSILNGSLSFYLSKLNIT